LQGELVERGALLAMAERYRAGVAGPPGDLYDAACLVSKCVELVQKDGSLAEAKRADLARSYAEHAMGALSQAVKAGYANAAWLSRDPDLQPLRSRQDFQKLLADVRERALRAATAERALQEKKVATDPKNTQLRADLAGTVITLGGLHWQMGRFSEGAREWQRAANVLEDGIANLDAGAPDAQQILARWRAMGSEYVCAGLWTKASACYDREFERGNPQDAREHWLTPALLRLLSADLNGYRQVCGGLRERIEKNAQYEDYMWACSLDNRAGVDPALLVKGAEQVVATHYQPWLRHVLALAYYRAGRFEDAAAAALESDKAQSWPGRNTNWPVLAMAHHRLGHTDEARKWLEQANREWRERSPLSKAIDAPNVLPMSSDDARFWQTIWQDWGIFQLLLAEANSLILGDRGEADCLDHLHQAYVRTKLGEPRKAEEEFQAAVRGRDKDAGAWLARGRVYMLLGDKERAQADFVKAQELNSKDPQVQKEYGASAAKEKGGR
jgi:tetratricopeptide (TPR) repeat protein